ncbi:hypothetical protein PUN28_011846 [Cardiocondyla obscurior]|uniref:Uncharacterized protein n=1 Tax=Cardiocondyla obscurior TaxID=286306 RepID=A0AAW2FHU6_9HYME
MHAIKSTDAPDIIPRRGDDRCRCPQILRCCGPRACTPCSVCRLRDRYVRLTALRRLPPQIRPDSWPAPGWNLYVKYNYFSGTEKTPGSPSRTGHSRYGT